MKIKIKNDEIYRNIDFDLWKNKWKKNNEYMIDELLKDKGIKRDWTYLDSTRSKLTTKKS